VLPPLTSTPCHLTRCPKKREHVQSYKKEPACYAINIWAVLCTTHTHTGNGDDSSLDTVLVVTCDAEWRCCEQGNEAMRDGNDRFKHMWRNQKIMVTCVTFSGTHSEFFKFDRYNVKVSRWGHTCYCWHKIFFYGIRRYVIFHTKCYVPRSNVSLVVCRSHTEC